MKQFFLFTWYQPLHELGGRPLHSQIHKLRDGWNSVYVASLLTELGYKFGGVIVNVPKQIPSTPEMPISAVKTEKNDIVWIPTRLPLNESGSNHAARPKRRLRFIDRSESSLERETIGRFQPYFRLCSRTCIAFGANVKLIPSQHNAETTCSDDAREYRVCEFQEFKGGLLTRHGNNASRLRETKLCRPTIGYLISLPPQGDAPRLVTAFAPGGSESLVFAHLLASFHRDKVARILNTQRPHLLMLLFQVPKTVPVPLLSYPVADLDPQVLFDGELAISRYKSE